MMPVKLCDYCGKEHEIHTIKGMWDIVFESCPEHPEFNFDKPPPPTPPPSGFDSWEAYWSKRHQDEQDEFWRNFPYNNDVE